jgi:hypothetical protein
MSKIKLKALPFLILLLGITSSANGQLSNVNIVLNHFLVIVDSITYQEILNSKILNSNFAYAHEKQLSGYSGIYVFGQNNYIEIFNPRSIQNELHSPGESWVCHTSLKVNHLESIDISNKSRIVYSTDEEFDDLSLYFQDSTNLFTTWEMNKNHYENWSKKIFHDSVTFLPVDYNSPADSDSSKNYLFKDVAGIKITLNHSDSSDVIDYLTLLGYSRSLSNTNTIRFSNSIDFIELDFQKEVKMASISTIYLNLKNESLTEQLQIGQTTLFIDGKQAVWILQ